MIASTSPSVDSFLTPLGAIFAGVGLVFLLIGIGLARSGRRFSRHAERTQGTVVGFAATTHSGSIGGDAAPGGEATLTPIASPEGGLVYRPTVVFTTRDGSEVRATSPFGGNPRPGRRGDTVRVLYDPLNPRRFRVDSGVGRGTCLAVALMLFGGVFAAIGVAVLVLAGR